MIELVSFLKRIVERAPYYKEAGPIYLELEKGGSSLVFDRMRDDTILYTFVEGSTRIHSWSPNQTGYSRYIVDGVSTVKPSCFSLINRDRKSLIIQTHKIFREDRNGDLLW